MWQAGLPSITHPSPPDLPVGWKLYGSGLHFQYLKTQFSHYTIYINDPSLRITAVFVTSSSVPENF
jgi:hypothetical protein